MKKFLKFFIVTIIIIAALSGLLIAIVFSFLNKKKNADYYTFGNDNIPSVKYVLGERDMDSFSNKINGGISSKIFHYTSATSKDDVYQYTEYLVEHEDFLKVEDDKNKYPVFYVKESKDEEKLIVVYVEYTAFDYTITVQKGKGSLN